MKKLIALSVLATLSSGAAVAENLNLGGSVESICEVSNIDTAHFFPTLAAGNSKNVTFDLQCNDADGATMSLTTSEGHLQNADNENRGVGYTAKLTAEAFDFTLSAEDGKNDQVASQSKPGSETLAAGGVAGNILLTVTQTPVYSGTYSDTLKLAITAN